MVQKVDFLGEDRLIVVRSGFDTLDVKEVYSDWKNWIKLDDNAKFAQAFSVIGGDPIGSGLYAGSYFFLLNGWKIRPQEANHTLSLIGNVFGADGAQIITPTLGTYTVAVNVVTSSQAQGVSTSGSSGPDPIENADALLDRSNAIETGLTLRQALRLLTTLLAGKTSGAWTGTERFRSAVSDQKERVTISINSSGNRVSVDTDLS